MSLVKRYAIVVGAILVVFSIIFMFVVFGLGVKSVTAPLSTEIDQKTFMNSQQYVDEATRDLQNYMFEYQKADEVQKALIKSTVQHQYANFPEDKVPQYLKSFYMEMMS